MTPKGVPRYLCPQLEFFFPHIRGINYKSDTLTGTFIIFNSVKQLIQIPSTSKADFLISCHIFFWLKTVKGIACVAGGIVGARNKILAAEPLIYSPRGFAVYF